MRARPLTLVLLLVPALAGCGGAKKGPPLTQAVLVKKADAVCRSYRSSIRKLPLPKTFGGIARYTEDSKSLVVDQVGKLKDLVPPKTLADDYDAYVTQVEAKEDTLDKIAAAAKKGDKKKVGAVTAQARTAARSSGKQAAAVGLKVCGKEL